MLIIRNFNLISVQSWKYLFYYFYFLRDISKKQLRRRLVKGMNLKVNFNYLSGFWSFELRIKKYKYKFVSEDHSITPTY